MEPVRTAPDPSHGPPALGGLPQLAAILENAERPGAAVHVHKLTGSAKALFAAAARKRTGRAVLYVAPGEDEADQLRSDLAVFLDEPVAYLPEHEAAPYDARAAHTETVALRLEAMGRLVTGEAKFAVTTAKGLLELVPGPATLREHLVELAVGASTDLEALLTRLVYLGYQRQGAVEEVGDFALRGGILDVYSLGGTHPIRIEVDYDEVVSIREFDVHTQRSVRNLERARILPRHELLLEPARIERAVAALRRRDPAAADELARSFEEDPHPHGIERMAGALEQDLGSPFRYLPDDVLVLLEEPGLVHGRLESLWEEVLAAHAAVSAKFPAVSAPEELFATPESVRAALDARSRIRLSDLTAEPEGAMPIAVRSSPPDSFGRKIDLWRSYLTALHQRGLTLLLYCDNEGQKRRLDELLVEEGVPVQLRLGVLAAGFVLEEAGLAVLTDHEFFGRIRRRAPARRFRSGFGLRELNALPRGSYVVHVDHGIARYAGMRRLEVNGQLTDVLHLEYQGGDKLYVPVDQLHLIQRYASEEGKAASLSRLGGTGWTKTKAKAKAAIQEMAGELIRAYAARKAYAGHAFGPDTVWQRELEGSFPFDETGDQLKAIAEVKGDMESPHPMDRLICGDVGYGKTEVAVRAAFKAVMDGRQVAVLVPTTILAEQHWNTFRERFAEFPVRIEMISRFRSPGEIAEIKKRVAAGEVDLILGTHALLAKDVRFKNLGLVIVDEEQRFGVAHKERLRGLRASVDVLTLTATPIPRTLNLSLLGARDITLIQTPPQGRMSVHTEIAEFERELIREALLREADRGGQSYFVHNRIHSIHSIGNYIRTLCPQLDVGVAHGQMAPRALEKVMLDFIDRRYDVLVSTMIIENGLDIPSVNTMIVNRADAFGLAQLYQLRGRVGRSTQKAHCLFLVPSHRALTENAMKRLRAIAEFDELGSGFALAMRDLEIRGSGNILGREQSGFVVSVGFEMYCRLLDEAVRELKGLPLDERPEPRLTTDLDAFLPDEYVENAEEKIGFYKRLAEAREPDAIDALETELRDRFGRLHPEAAALFDLRRARVAGASLGLASVLVKGGRIELELSAPPKPGDLKDWMRRIPMPVEFAATGRFVLKAKGGIAEALALLAAMAGVAPPAREALPTVGAS